MDETKLEAGKLRHMLEEVSADADVSAMLKKLLTEDYPVGVLELPAGTITAGEVIEQCKRQSPQNIVSGYSVETGLTFTPVPRPS